VEQLEVAAARYRLGRQTGEALRDLGVALLSDDHHTAVGLAIADDLAMSTIGPVFEKVCQQLGQAIPPLDAAIDIVTAALLSDITEGVVTPLVGLQHLMDDVVHPHVTAETTAGEHQYAGESRGLQHLIGAYWGYDSLRERPAELSIDGKFGGEAVALLDQEVVGFARDWLDQQERGIG
jgi:hypothetical protein